MDEAKNQKVVIIHDLLLKFGFQAQNGGLQPFENLGMKD